MKKILIVDATNYLFRAFYAHGNLTSDSGEPTGAIYGLMKMLQTLRKHHPTDYFVCVMDAHGHNFRSTIYEEYKKNRPPMQSEIRNQIEPAKEFINALGWRLMCEIGVEADDVIGSLTKQAESEGLGVLIATGDKDMMQLVSDNVKVITSATEKPKDANGVFEKFGVKPNQILEYLMLVGDSSDNIPGVPKIGAKTAAKLLTEYGNIDKIMEQAFAQEGKPKKDCKMTENMAKNLREFRTSNNENINRKLITLKDDLFLPFGPKECVQWTRDEDYLKTLCHRYTIRNLLKDDDVRGRDNEF